MARPWYSRLSTWLMEQALPLWWDKGTDHRHGGFFEKIALDGTVLDEPRRTRVTARQIYVFSVAHDMGWSGPALQAVEHGVDFLLNRLARPDGTFASSVTPAGHIVDDRFDLYEQAFALFSMAAAYKVQPSLGHLADRAEALYACLVARWKHPAFGFEEAMPPVAPLKSNPHMHLLEAMLAWSKLGSDAARARWSARASELVDLCLRHLIDPATGALREYFNADWSPQPGLDGRIIEPGHQFEWAWLLTSWAMQTGQRPSCIDAARRLMAIGEQHGVGPHGLVVNELLDDFSVKDASARLWPQTERVRAWALMAALDGADRSAPAVRHLTAACEGLARHFDGAPPGLWHEITTPTGQIQPQPCRASSLYHIVGAIECMHAHRNLMVRT